MLNMKTRWLYSNLIYLPKLNGDIDCTNLLSKIKMNTVNHSRLKNLLYWEHTTTNYG